MQEERLPTSGAGRRPDPDQARGPTKTPDGSAPLPIPFVFEPALLDALTLELRSRPGAIPGSVDLPGFEERIGAIYDRCEGSERRRRLDRENQGLVVASGLPARIMTPLEAYPAVREALASIAFINPVGGEEGVDPRGPDASGRLSLVVSLDLDSWFDTGRTPTLVRHELEHVADTLRPDFAYDPRAPWPGTTRGQQLVARQRYALLWCARVDARLERQDRPPLAGRAGYRDRCARMFPALEGEALDRLLDEVRDRDRWTQAELLERAGSSPFRPASSGSRQGPCALCAFPSSRWAADVAGDEDLVSFIKSEQPDWDPAMGLCERCHEGYQCRLEARPATRDRHAREPFREAP